MAYHYRPSVSPVVAGLFAAGVIRPHHRVLDVGCGIGTDCLAMIAWNIRSVVGIDDDERAIETAKRRAEIYKLSTRIFHHVSITNPRGFFAEKKFDIVIDSLCWTNIHARNPRATPIYARQISRILSPHGLLVLQVRENRHIFQVNEAQGYLPTVFGRHFLMSPVVTTHLPATPRRRGERGHVSVAVIVGRRRARPLRK